MTFRVQKGTATATPGASSSQSQVTPSGNTVVTVSREAYSSALRAASKVIASVEKGPRKR